MKEIECPVEAKKGRFNGRKSGLPSGDRQFRQWFKFFAGELLVNIITYVDESGTHDKTGKQPSSQVAVIAGYAAKMESWNKFRKDWGRLLSEYGARHFHYSTLNYAIRQLKSGKPIQQVDNPYREWALEKCERFLSECASVAASGSKIPFARTFDVKKYTEAKALVAPAQNEDPYILAMEDFFKMAMEDITAKWRRLKRPVSFFFDRNDNPDWEKAVLDGSKDVSGVGSITFQNKETAQYYGLQAADLICGRLREITRGEHGYNNKLAQLSDLDRSLFSPLGVKTTQGLLSKYKMPPALNGILPQKAT